MSDDVRAVSNNEPLEVKIIAAASDGYVNVTPEKCERIRQLIEARVQAAAVEMQERCAKAICWACAERIPKLTNGQHEHTPEDDYDDYKEIHCHAKAILSVSAPSGALDAMLLRARNEERQTILNDMKRIGPNCNHPARCFSHIDPDPLKNVCDVCSMRIAMIEACAKYASEGLQDCHRGDYDPCSPHAVDCKTAVYEGIRALTQPAPERKEK